LIATTSSLAGLLQSDNHAGNVQRKQRSGRWCSSRRRAAGSMQERVLEVKEQRGDDARLPQSNAHGWELQTVTTAGAMEVWG
jgi:hypothetical protein